MTTIKVLPWIKIIEEKPLIDKIFDFLLEQEIGTSTINELSKKFNLSKNFAQRIVESFQSGNYLISLGY